MLQSAIKAKAPVVAIPVEGHAPFCVDGKRLRVWAKGVTITRVEVVQNPDEYYAYEIPVQGYRCEGPKDIECVTVKGSRWLEIAGHVGKIHTKARFVPIARIEAIKTLSKWSDQERVRLEKKTLLGALSPADKRALKLAAIEGESTPVSIPELPLLSFVVSKNPNDTFSVKEVLSGKVAGSGNSPESAILAARQNARKASPEARAKLTAEIMLAAA